MCSPAVSWVLFSCFKWLYSYFKENLRDGSASVIHFFSRYVEKDLRDKYGLLELPLPNAWTYLTQTPKERRETHTEDNTDASEEGTKTPKTPKIIPITAFTRRLTPTPVSSTNTSPVSDASSHPSEDAKISYQESPQPSTSACGSPSVAAKSASVSPTSAGVSRTPTRRPSLTSGRRLITTPAGKHKTTPPGKSPNVAGQPKKRTRGQDNSAAQQPSLTAFFKKTGDRVAADSEKSLKSTEVQEELDSECITIEWQTWQRIR